MESSFHFEVHAADTPTENALRDVVTRGSSCFVEGTRGSGKTYAVRKALPEAVWVNLEDGPLQVPRFLVQVARQLNGGAKNVAGHAPCAQADAGYALLETACSSDLDRTLTAADAALAGRCLVVDRVEAASATAEWSWDDPRALWLTERARLFGWLRRRSSSAPTVFVGRRAPRDWPTPRVEHQPPRDWPIKLRYSPGGFANWQGLADGCLRSRPAGLVLGRALLPMLGPAGFNDLVDRLTWEGAAPDESLTSLLDEFRLRAPRGWLRALALADALGEAPRAILAQALGEDGDATASALERQGLLERRDDRVAPLDVVRFTRSWSAAQDDPAWVAAFRSAAALLLKGVNDLGSLRPSDAELVLQAHALFVAIGDDENARSTARFHVAGLVDLARRTSLAERWDDARRQYEAIRSMMDASPTRMTDESWGLTRSYVAHYRGFNGHRAGTVPDAQVLSDYDEAARLWPANALWHSRLIAHLVRLGRFDEAESRMDVAYGAVAPHPRRDGLLRIRPAVQALDQGAVSFALRLLDPALSLLEATDVDPEGAQVLRGLLNRLANGTDVLELSCHGGRLVFLSPAKLVVNRLASSWRAHLSDLSVAAQSAQGGAALVELADRVVQEVTRMVRTPSHRLAEEDLRRKGRFLGCVDVLNSDLGLEHATHRWFLGRFDGALFVPAQPGYEPVPASAGPLPTGQALPGGLHFALVPVLRDGHPSGPVSRLVPAGGGRTYRELMAALVQLPDPEEVLRDPS